MGGVKNRGGGVKNRTERRSVEQNRGVKNRTEAECRTEEE